MIAIVSPVLKGPHAVVQLKSTPFFKISVQPAPHVAVNVPPADQLKATALLVSVVLKGWPITFVKLNGAARLTLVTFQRPESVSPTVTNAVVVVA